MTLVTKHDYFNMTPNNDTTQKYYFQDRRLSFNVLEHKLLKSLRIALPDTPYERWKLELNQQGFWTDDFTPVTECPFPGDVGAPTLDEARLKQKSIINANRKFYDKLSKVDSYNMAVSLAEANKSVAMIAATAAQLATAFRHLKNGRIGLAMKSLRGDLSGHLTARDISIAGLATRRRGWSIAEHVRYLERRVPTIGHERKVAASSTWLQIQYGWTPLILDVYGLAQYAATEINRRSYDFRVKAGARAHEIIEIDNSNHEYWFLNKIHRETWDLAYTRRYKIDLLISDPNLRMAEALGLLNPALVAWELVPYSFVVDWFIPIGKALEQLTSRIGYSIVSGQVSDKTEVTGSGFYDTVETRPWGWPVKKTTKATFTYKHDRYIRSIDHSWPSFEWPPFDIWGFLSPKKIASSLSLLTIAFLT